MYNSLTDKLINCGNAQEESALLQTDQSVAACVNNTCSYSSRKAHMLCHRPSEGFVAML